VAAGREVGVTQGVGVRVLEECIDFLIGLTSTL
jgi:hypothetical protein